MSSSISFSQDEYQRYSRQLILPEIGVEGQKKLKQTSVLIIGAGGLGCPSSLYLTAAGVGRIGLVDSDVVELSNLHRQTLHTSDRVGISKVTSAIESLKALNSNVTFDAITGKFDRSNALRIVSDYDIVVDATDNVVARYLISDACVLSKKPLVSGSALRFDGQLTTYNYGENTPCYRCLFPQPPPANTVTNCSDGGVLGVIPGIIGNLQALEVIKIAAGITPSYAGSMLLFDGKEGKFRNLKIRGKKSDCFACSPVTKLTPDLIDYEAFTGSAPCETSQTLKILLPFERMSCSEYKTSMMDSEVNHLLIDVRPQVEQDIVKLPHAVSIPLAQLKNPDGLVKVQTLMKDKGTKNVVFMCRRGNASQMATRFLKDSLSELDMEAKDLVGGIEGWKREVDHSIPSY